MPAALCFDMYGTLYDTSSVDRRVRERLDVPAGVVADAVALWREKQLQYSYQAALMGEYRTFWELTGRAFDYAADYYGLDPRAADRDAIMGAYEELSPFEDAPAALTQLEGTDMRLAILSNGNPEMLRTLAENTGLAEHFEAIISADEVETFKPDPAVYDNAADRLDLPIGECWLVSSNAWDVAGAAAAGMGTAWVNRANEPPERVGGEADVRLDSLSDLAGEVA